MKILDHPIIYYLVIALVSLTCAILLFYLGGSLAEVSGDQNSWLGFSFKASGGIGGFIIIFWLSQKVVMRFSEGHDGGDQKINIKVYLESKDGEFDRSNTSYLAEYNIFNEDTGDNQKYQTSPFWEAGFLTVQARNVGDSDYLTITVRDSADNVWESDSFHSRSPKIAQLQKLS